MFVFVHSVEQKSPVFWRVFACLLMCIQSWYLLSLFVNFRGVSFVKFSFACVAIVNGVTAFLTFFHYSISCIYKTLSPTSSVGERAFLVHLWIIDVFWIFDNIGNFWLRMKIPVFAKNRIFAYLYPFSEKYSILNAINSPLKSCICWVIIWLYALVRRLCHMFANLRNLAQLYDWRLYHPRRWFARHRHE